MVLQTKFQNRVLTNKVLANKVLANLGESDRIDATGIKKRPVSGGKLLPAPAFWYPGYTGRKNARA